MFGTPGGIAARVAFAAMTIPVTLGFVWVFAHVMETAIYVTSIVAVIGLAIAIGYSTRGEAHVAARAARSDGARHSWNG